MKDEMKPSPASAASVAAASSPAAVRIVTLGDSITKGVRPGVLAEQTFAALIEAALRAGGLAVEVINVGIGAERTDQALARLAGDVIARKPAVVTVMYGTNDSYVDIGKAASRLTVEQYRSNLETIVDQLRSAGVEVVLMTEPRWGLAAKLNGVGEHPNIRLALYVDACRSVAAAKAVPLVDHFKHWSDAQAAGTDVGEWTTDQCHPNPAGHRVLAEAMLPVIESVLRA